MNRLGRTDMGDIILRILLASSSPGEWGKFNRTLSKPAHLPHESVRGSAPPLFPPLSLPLPRLPCPRVEEMDGLALADTRAPDIVSVGGTRCDSHGRTCLAPRWGL